MFLESQINHPMQKGSIEVICGSMFSGKTEELLRRLKRAEFAKLKIVVFKPIVDKRYDTQKVVSHNENTIPAIAVESAKDIFRLAKGFQVVAIDEAQFFDLELVAVCTKLANASVRVIIAGLDMDFLGTPFGIMPKLLSIAEDITKVHAICVDCCAIANHSFRKTSDKALIQIGEKEEYKPLCRSCFFKNMS
jgi:thymidine kinase